MVTPNIQSSKRQNAFESMLRRVLLVAAIGMGGTVAVQTHLAGDRFKQGEAAYTAQDCQAAIPHYERILNSNRLIDFNSYGERARVRKAECQAALEVEKVRRTKDKVATVVAAYNYLASYPQGIFADPFRQQAQQIIKQQQPAQLAKAEICDRLDSLLTAQVLPKSTDMVPALGYRCGQQYAAKQNYKAAIARYQQVMRDYPKHKMMPPIEGALAQALVAQAQTQGAGAIPQPPLSGSAAPGTTVLVIQNSSPEPMRIALSGAEDRIEVLAACTDCQTHAEAPEACPNAGPVGIYPLKPGLYNIVISSSKDFLVAPFVGEWSLQDGAEYSTCFYTVQKPAQQ